jgi:hypothetical protein
MHPASRFFLSFGASEPHEKTCWLVCMGSSVPKVYLTFRAPPTGGQAGATPNVVTFARPELAVLEVTPDPLQPRGRQF